MLQAKLFDCCLVHDFVPESFAPSFIVPVPKGDASKLNVLEGCRPVSMINVISKIFELCLLNVLNRFIINNELQLGFTAGKSCQKAPLMFSTVIDCLNDRGCNVHVSGLDVAKAFDSVNYYGIFIKLMKVHVPLCILNTLENWYGKLSGCVRWAGVLSQQFSKRSGVKEGSVISPLLFSLYINDLIIVLRSQSYWFCLGDMFIGCLLFADDVLLLSASVLQQFNFKKSTVMVVGKGDNALLPVMMLVDGVLNWIRKIKYLYRCVLLFAEGT